MPTRMLALDTSTEACSVALLNHHNIDARFAYCPREHTQRILPMVQQVLADNQLVLTQLDALAYGHGPGSFTGVRIALGVAQGLAFGAGLPLIGVSTLAALAQGTWRLTGATRVLTAIDARMGELYWAEYQRDEQGSWQGEVSETVLKPEAAIARMMQLNGKWSVAGSGWQGYPVLTTQSSLNLTKAKVVLPVAEDMLALAVQGLSQGMGVTAEQAELVYLRNDVAWKKIPPHQ